MNRRELFQKVAATVAGAGVAEASLSAVTVSAEAKPALFVLEHPGPLSPGTTARLSSMFSENMAGTPFEGVKCVVLTEGLRLTVLDASGKVLNERIEPDAVNLTFNVNALDPKDIKGLVSSPGGIADQVIDAVSRGKRGRDELLRRGLSTV